MKSFKQHIFYTYLLIVSALFTSSCTTNNGNIGELYGAWALDKITINDAEQTSWHDGGWYCEWRFQNNIIQIHRFNALHDYSHSTGTFTHEGKNLNINFTHSDDDNAAGTGPYAAPTWIYFSPGTTIFNIDKLSSSAMVLSTTNDQGQIITYYLSKR